MVGAGLSGLACALYLSSTGREVTVLEQRGMPGGRHGTLELDGFRFDTGPALPPPPEAIAAPLHAVGEHLRDWIEFLPLDPICRAHYPDGTSLDVSSDPHRTAAAIGALCGGREARAYLRYLKGAPYRVPVEMFFNDPRTLRLFGSASLFGFSVLGSAWHPRGGIHAIPRALAMVAEKRGVNLRFDAKVHAWETCGNRVTAVHTTEGERLAADAFVFPAGRVGAAKDPSHLVIHLGGQASYQKIAHHNLHFGKPWMRSRHEVLVRGELMSDPTVLVSNPSRTDPSLGRHTYQVVVPVPNLKSAPLDWDGPATRAYSGEILATLEARGYLDLGVGLTTSYVVTPADWARQGMPYGIPHSPTKRPSRLHSALGNVVIAGPGLDAGRTAAEKVVGV